MDELTRAPERILIDCFRALDAGASNDDCFARYPRQADSLRVVLDMRAQLLTLKTTAPSPTTFASGREALLARVVRPLASSHPGSMESEGRPARGFVWRPATRAAFAGALLFAMASCAIGVSATPATDKIDQALPDIPTIDVPEQRPIYPFPQFNDAPPGMLPTAEPTDSGPVEAEPQPNAQPQSDPSVEPSNSQDTDSSEQEAKPSSPGDTWLPPVNAHETDPPEDVTTPDSTDQPDASDHNGGNDDEDTADGPANGHENGDGLHSEDDDDGSSNQGEISADAATSD